MYDVNISLFISALPFLYLCPDPVFLSSLRIFSTTTTALLTWDLHRHQRLSTLSLYNTHTQSVTHNFNINSSEPQYAVKDLQPGTRFKAQVVITTSMKHLNITLKQRLSIGLETGTVHLLYHKHMTITWSNLRGKILFILTWCISKECCCGCNLGSVSVSWQWLLSPAQCHTGWLANGRSCYSVRRAGLAWRDAQHSCRAQAAGSHLADLKTLADLHFVSSHLLRHNTLVMLWTGLNDQQVALW